MKNNINELIAGVDEVGRGAWAGPIVAAAVIFKDNFEFELKDSKKLTPKRRQVLAKEIKKVSHWAIGIVSRSEIDKIGLQPANILVAIRAVENLPIRPTSLKVDMIRKFSYELPFELIIGGDDKVFEIMAASIIAKDYRDNMMIEFDKQYGEYVFSSHKGYGTALHREAIAKHGICVLHRTSFAPIKKFIKN
jgi:ribonuclease HII